MVKLFGSKMRLRPFRVNRLARDERGATAVEFALLAVPFFAIIGAIMETSVVFLANEVLDSAVHDATRLIRTGQAQQSGFDVEDFRAAVCEHTFGMIDCDAIHFTVSPITDFASADPTPPIELDCAAPCDWTEPESYNAGSGSSIVLVQAYYKWPTVLDFFDFSLASLADGTRLLTSVRVLRNEPFTSGTGGGGTGGGVSG